MKNSSKITPTYASGTVTSGGTAQNALAANGARGFLMVQNHPDETENLVVAFGRTAVVDVDITLEPGAILAFDRAVPETLVSVLAATTGHRFILLWG